MATVNVNSWQEFLTAIAVSGDTVVLPEEAVWDANDFAPLGVLDDINWECETVEGRGTIIRNIHLYAKIIRGSGYQYVNDLHLLDFIADGEPTYGGLFEGDYFFKGCKISGILTNGYRWLIRNPSNVNKYILDRCSINLEFQKETTGSIGISDTPCNGSIYSRVQIKAPNAGDITHQPMEYCEVVYYYSNASNKFASFYYTGCTVRGNFQGMQTTESWAGSWSGANSVYCIESFPAGYTPKYPANFIGVTDAQLKDPAYLRNIGFPIAVVGG